MKKNAEAEKESEKRKYPIGEEHYLLYEEVGQGVSASVHRALCVPLNEVVAIKILDFERENSDLASISREAQTMILVDHPNLLKSHCSFVSGQNLWVVMPFMAGGSCLHILKAAYPDGLEEVVIATVLREALKGVEYLHRHGHIHRDIKAGNILIDSRGAIKLGDFGVSACLFDSGDRQRTRNTFVGTPCWMAPEVMQQLRGYDFKADIWSFGITALELAHGHAPFSKYPPMKVLLMTLQSAPPGLDYERDKKFSKSFKQMIASCLDKEPSKRPSSKKLLKHSFFKQARSSDYIARTLLEGLPALGDRIMALKRKEQDMLAQKKIPDGQKEEISQNEYKRGISGWNFNLEVMKAEASLIQDVEDFMYDNSSEGFSSVVSSVDGHDKQQLLFSSMSQYPELSDMEDNDGLQNQLATLPLFDSTRNTIIHRSERSEDDLAIANSNQEVHDERNGNKSSERSDLENVGRGLDGNATGSHQRRMGSSGSISLAEVPTRLCRVDSEKIHLNVNLNSNVVTVPSAEDAVSDFPPKASKSSAANGDDLDEKAKVPVVQQKGRFKVTSENVDVEKVVPSPILQKSHSMQVITQHNSIPPSPLQSPSDLASGNSSLEKLVMLLYGNIQQRELVLTLIRQAIDGEITVHRPTDGGGVPAHTFDRSMLEGAHEREREILHDIIESQQSKRLFPQDETKKLKPETSQSQNEEKQTTQRPSTKANGGAEPKINLE